MAYKPKVLVFGATGTIGRYIVHELANAKPSFGRLGAFTSAVTLQKKPHEIEKLKSNGFDIITGDIENEEDVLRGYEGFDTVVSTLGRNVIQAQIPLLSLAEHKAPQIKRFFPSEYGTDIEFNTTTSPHEKPHQQKLKVRKWIKENLKRVEYTYLVTGPYADMYLWPAGGDARGGSWDVMRTRATLLGTGKEEVSLTTMRDVGRLLVAALLHPEESRNRALIVNSFTATPNQILREFELNTRAKWDVQYTSLDELKKLEKEQWDQMNPAATGTTLRRIWTEGGTLYDHRDNEKIGAPPSETLHDAVVRQIREQKENKYLVPGL